MPGRLLIIFLFLFSFCKAQQLKLADLGLVPPFVANCTSVKDQYISSTCWSFSSTSLLESELMKMGKGEIDLSEMYIARYSMVRKIQRHLKLKGSNFFTPGGQFHDAIWVIKNYGIVPEEAFPGKRQGELNHNHAEMDTIFSVFVKDCINKNMTSLNEMQTIFVDSVLDHYLGHVPAEIIYKGKTFTPQTFLNQYLDFNPDDFVEITSYTHHPFYKPFILEDKYNWTNDEYYNVTISDFSRITDYALANGYTVSWDGDAADDHFNFNEGLAYLTVPIRNFQVQRQLAFKNKTTELDHMMHIVGNVKDKKGDKWYYIKNSWGDYSNLLGGFLFMREDYFKIRTLAIIVNKNGIPPDIKLKMGI